MAYAGVDLSAFPGLAAMAWLRDHTNLAWTGFYLAPAPSHANTGWMGQRAALAAQGWGFAPIYVGQELKGPGSHLVTAAHGHTDGLEASALMGQAGFRPGSAGFLDLEDGAPFVEPRRSYVVAWALAFQGPTIEGKPSGYHVGVYCSHAIAEDVRDALIDGGIEAPQVWAFKVDTVEDHNVPGVQFSQADPYGCGVAWATMWQHDQNALIQLADRDLQVDLSVSLYGDPSDSVGR